MIEFTHQIPTKIIFGPDKLGQLGTELASTRQSPPCRKRASPGSNRAA